MAGGTRAWAAAGFELFTGVNVPSKAFGELVEHRCEHAAYRRRRAEAPARCGRRNADRRQPADRRIPQHEHPRRVRLPRRRAGLPRAGPAALARQPRRRQLRRAHAQHHRRPVAAQCRARQPGDGARKRHDGLGAGRARTGARPRGRCIAATLARGAREGSRARRRCRRTLRHRADRRCRARPLRGRRRSSARSICSTCAAPRSMRRAISRARARRRAASWCRRPTPIWRPATPASSCSTTTACAR